MNISSLFSVPPPGQIDSVSGLIRLAQIDTDSRDISFAACMKTFNRVLPDIGWSMLGYCAGHLGGGNHGSFVFRLDMQDDKPINFFWGHCDPENRGEPDLYRYQRQPARHMMGHSWEPLRTPVALTPVEKTLCIETREEFNRLVEWPRTRFGISSQPVATQKAVRLCKDNKHGLYNEYKGNPVHLDTLFDLWPVVDHAA